MKSEHKHFKKEVKFIDTEMKSFIESNYLESYPHAKELLIEAIIKYPFTTEGIYEGLQILMEAYGSKQYLIIQLNFIGDLTQYGVSASVAGEKLRDVLLDSHKHIKP